MAVTSWINYVEDTVTYLDLKIKHLQWIPHWNPSQLSQLILGQSRWEQTDPPKPQTPMLWQCLPADCHWSCVWESHQLYHPHLSICHAGTRDVPAPALWPSMEKRPGNMFSLGCAFVWSTHFYNESALTHAKHLIHDFQKSHDWLSFCCSLDLVILIALALSSAE